MWGACPEEVDVCYGVRDHGRFTEDLTGIRKSAGPQLETLQKELRAVLRRYQQPPAEEKVE